MNLIRGLPRNSHYMQAVSMDREMAEMYLAMPEEVSLPTDAAIAMVDYSPEAELLMAAVNMVAENLRATVASAGGKPPRIAPLRGPKTAVQIIKSERRAAAHYTLVERVTRRKN